MCIMSFLSNSTGSVLRAEQVFNDGISVNKSFEKKALLETKLAGPERVGERARFLPLVN